MFMSCEDCKVVVSRKMVEHSQISLITYTWVLLLRWYYFADCYLGEHVRPEYFEEDREQLLLAGEAQSERLQFELVGVVQHLVKDITQCLIDFGSPLRLEHLGNDLLVLHQVAFLVTFAHSENVLQFHLPSPRNPYHPQELFHFEVIVHNLLNQVNAYFVLNHDSMTCLIFIFA